jgi:hypothetical protein
MDFPKDSTIEIIKDTSCTVTSLIYTPYLEPAGVYEEAFESHAGLSAGLNQLFSSTGTGEIQRILAKVFEIISR